VNLSSVVFAEVKIHQSPSIQTHRSVAVSNRERVSNQQFKREDERSKQSISGSCQPQTPSTHTIPLDKLSSTKQQSVRRAAL
jgi:hypothetical protein